MSKILIRSSFSILERKTFLDDVRKKLLTLRMLGGMASSNIEGVPHV